MHDCRRLDQNTKEAVKMKGAYELVLVFLRFWLLGLFLFGVIAAADSTFRDGKYPKGHFYLRLKYALLWPLSLCSANGRKVLFNLVKETQQ